MEKHYIGLTIGPIVDTMSYSSTPGALWFASYLFSSITRKLCKGIEGEYCDSHVNIFSLKKNEDGQIDNTYYDYQFYSGIGVYHDRIYFSVEVETVHKKKISDRLKTVINTVISDMAAELSKAFEDSETQSCNSQSNAAGIMADLEEFLDRYLQIHFVIISENEISGGLSQVLADRLDALELCRKIEFEAGNNYLRRIMEGSSARGNNYYIRQYVEALQMESEDRTGIFINNRQRIKTLIELASEGIIKDENDIKKLDDKTKRYFAVVYADGDNMGQLLSVPGGSMAEQEERISQFSSLCTRYTEKAVHRINDYGGGIIYAGGDDLLFLAPVCSKKAGKDVWGLCNEIASDFQALSADWIKRAGIHTDKTPSISFGVSVNYYKFPLYEALDDARYLLFEQSKHFGEKNNISIKIHKASGQTQGFVCKLETELYSYFCKLVSEIYIKDTAGASSGKENDNEGDKLLHSVVYHMENKRSVFEYAMEHSGTDRVLLSRLFEMIKSNLPEKLNRSERVIRQMNVIEMLAGKVSESIDNKTVKGFSDEGKTEKEQYPHCCILAGMLRCAKFLVEAD